MFEHLKIYRDKRITLIDVYSEGLHETDTTLIPYNILNLPVVFEDDFTLNDLFDLIETYPILQAYCTLFDEFNEERKQPVADEDLLSGIFEFHWHNYDEDMETNFARTKMDTHLVETDENGETTKYSMSFTPLNHYAHLPIDIYERISEEKYIDDKLDIKELGDCLPTLLHIINGLFFELSFHGNPESRDKEKEKLMEAIEEVRRGEFTPFEDVIENIKNKKD